MEQKPSSVPALAFLVLRTTREKEVLAFYGALGLVFVAEKHGRGVRHHASDLGGPVLEIYPRYPGEQDPPQDGIIVGLRVGSIEDAQIALHEAGFGAPPRPPPGTGRLLTAKLADPDGRQVILTVR